MRNTTYILGCGGHGRVILDNLRSTKDGQRLDVQFLDERRELWGSSVDGAPISGGSDLLRSGDSLFLGVGDNITRASLYNKYKELGCVFPSLLAASAVVSPRARIREGVVVFAGAIVQTGAQIHENVVINTGAVVEHDNVIGAHVQLAPRVALSGNVSVGEGTLLGTGVSVNKGVRIGEYCLISPGVPVIQDIGDHLVYKHKPAGYLIEENYRVATISGIDELSGT